MEPHLKAIGIILASLGLVHVIFPRYFNWKTELNGLSLINRQLMYVHTFFIGLVVAGMGLFCFFNATAMVSTPLGAKLSLSLCIFWGMRLYVQFFVYSPELWRGKRFETAVHILFSIFWVYLTVVFGLVYYLQG